MRRPPLLVVGFAGECQAKAAVVWITRIAPGDYFGSIKVKFSSGSCVIKKSFDKPGSLQQSSIAVSGGQVTTGEPDNKTVNRIQDATRYTLITTNCQTPALILPLPHADLHTGAGHHLHPSSWWWDYSFRKQTFAETKDIYRRQTRIFNLIDDLDSWDPGAWRVQPE